MAQAFAGRKVGALFRKINGLLVLTVIVPTIASILYFGFIASDIFVSESHFVIRSPQRQNTAGLGALLMGAGFTRSQDDANTVHDFMLSRDALQRLNNELNFEKRYSSDRIDLLNRFAPFNLDRNFESLHRYYQKHVTIESDNSSSISILKVSGFSANDASGINMALLAMGEQLINVLNERGRQDMIRFAQAEMQSSETKARASAKALSEFRTKNGVFDTDRQSALQLTQVAKIQDELTAARAQLSQLTTFTPDNPQIPALKQRIQTLEKITESEMAKVTGGTSSFASKSGEYERLVLERAFADKQLGVAAAALETASNEAQRKQLYLERIVQPSHPDVAVEPRRIRAIFATFIIGLICWGVLTIFLSGVKEHRA